jgi:hypothetical protein
MAETQLTPQVRADIARIYESDADYLPGLSSDEKKARLARISYGDYLVRVVDADPGVLPFFQAMTHGELASMRSVRSRSGPSISLPSRASISGPDQRRIWDIPPPAMQLVDPRHFIFPTGMPRSLACWYGI